MNYYQIQAWYTSQYVYWWQRKSPLITMSRDNNNNKDYCCFLTLGIAGILATIHQSDVLVNTSPAEGSTPCRGQVRGIADASPCRGHFVPKPLVGGFGYLELCLYGRRELLPINQWEQSLVGRRPMRVENSDHQVGLGEKNIIAPC